MVLYRGGEKRKEVAGGPKPPSGLIVKRRRAVRDCVSSLINTESSVDVHSNFCGFLKNKDIHF